MAGYISGDTRKVTTHRLVEMKQRGEKISMLTSYDYTTAQIVDGAGIDVILVGDSASNVMAGNVTTLPITLDQMIYHGKSVVRSVIAKMFGTDENYDVIVNPDKGDFEIWRNREVVADEDLTNPNMQISLTEAHYGKTLRVHSP